MSLRHHLLTLLACVLTLPRPLQATEFTTPRLRHLATCLQLPPDEAATPAAPSTYHYRSHALAVRRTADGRVEHIGLRLFTDEQRRRQPSPAYDFLERNLLERNLLRPGDSLRHVLETEHVAFLTGSAATALRLDGTETFRLSSRHLRSYEAAWQRGGRTLLHIRFDMDWQLLSGCNAPQLEAIYLRRLLDYKPAATASDRPAATVSDRPADTAVDTFQTRMMRHELFWDGTADARRLIDSPEQPTATLYNLMLATDLGRTVQLDLVFDRYGYATDSLHLPLRQWLLMCREEGCQSYFGIRRKDTREYHGTLIQVNGSGGYAHLLSVRIPASVLDRTADRISGRLYAYVPLHNIAENFFK